MAIIINGTLNINNLSKTSIGREYIPVATYSVTWQSGLLQILAIGSLSGTVFTPAANNITVPLAHQFDPSYTVYSGSAPLINNTPITLTLNKGLVDTIYNVGIVYYNKNGITQSTLELSPGADSYTFNVTTNQNDSVEFFISTFND
jgi:hypothetical protein